MEDEKYKKYLQNAKLEFTLERLKKESKRVCFSVYNSIKNGKFIPKHFEKKFGRGEEVLPIKIKGDTKTYEVKGVVDRIDSYGDYIRVIDYKSGKIHENDENFYTGNKIQLYLYMNAFINDSVKPAGAYYYPIKDVYSETQENYTMLGKTLIDNEVIEATDLNLNKTNTSTIVKLKKNKDGGLAKTSQVLSKEGFQSYLKYAKEIAKNGINEISSGYINPTPYEGACNYCEYGGMCRFCAEEGGRFRKIYDVNSQTIIGAVEEKQEDKADNQDE
jgi:ATP-dependent helicase/nuclease subunit B